MFPYYYLTLYSFLEYFLDLFFLISLYPFYSFFLYAVVNVLKAFGQKKEHKQNISDSEYLLCPAVLQTNTWFAGILTAP